MTNFTKYMRLLALGITFSASMALPYVHIKFYDVIREATQATNNELGLLMTIFTGVGMLLYIPGGVLADRGSPKKLLIISLAMMAALNTIFAVHTSYVMALLIWALLAVSANMIQWPTLIKAVRDTGSKEEQGRMFGTFYGATGIFSSLIGFAGAALYSSVDDRIQGFHYMLYGQAVIAVLALIAVAMFVDDKTEYNQNVSVPEENPFKSALTVMKLPAVWMMVILIFCGYGMYIGIAYMTPYTTNVLGVSITFGAILGTIRAFGLRILTGPFSGYISDKIGSTAKIRHGVLPSPHRDAVRASPPACGHLQHYDHPTHHDVQLLWAGGVHYHVLLYGRSTHSTAVHRHLGQRDQFARLPARRHFLAPVRTLARCLR